MITNSRDDHFVAFGRTLSDPANGPKTYRTALNKIIIKKKMTNIPHLLENGIFVTNFQTETDMFNELFV